MSFLEINEAWVKERVKITNEKLDDIKSLYLPGTYDEKIYKIGPSLRNFSRLKELDLSRNLLESLEGMEHLQCLESLNLYYNNVSLLKELYRLRNNTSLAQLDLRLNPVARNEADYRLCLIHMLPLLVRLDDRCVKDQERKAALMYFGSDQSREFSINPDERHVGSDRAVVTVKKTHPRVEMVNRWTKGIVKEDFFETKRNDNDVFHLNLNEINIDETNNMTAPRPSDHRSAKEYSPRDSRNFSNKRLSVEREISDGKSRSGSRTNKSLSNFSTVPVFIRQDEAMTSKADRNKADGDGVNNVGHVEERRVDLDHKSLSHVTYSRVHTSSPSDEEMEAVLPKEVTDKMCDLIDRYWNGNHSLHRHQRFLIAISEIISKSLTNPSENGDHKEEVNHLRHDLAKLEEENIQLKEKISSERRLGSNSINKESVTDIRRTNMALKDEISELKLKLEASEKIREITDLLKQSHDSLITTNEQLRRQVSQQNRGYKSRDY